MGLLTLITIFSLCRIVSSQFGTIQRLVGENITLTCAPSYNVPDKYSIFWYREGRQSDDDDERFSVACERGFKTDSCSLTVSALTTNDSDTYVCAYYDGKYYNQIVGMNLTVTDGQLPSDDTPVCEIYEAAIDGGYISSNKSKVFKIGDEIFLWCTVLESDIKPSLSWIREQENNITKLTENATGRTLFLLVNLTTMDVGARFSCLMNHPASSKTRNCSIIPLPVLSPPPPPTTTTTTTQRLTTLIKVITIILIIVATIAIVLVVVLKKRRKKNGLISSKPNYELICKGGQSISAENTPDKVERKQRNNQNELSDISHNRRDGKDELHTTNYTELNLSEVKSRTYVELTSKTPSMNNQNAVHDAYESINFTDHEETTLHNNGYEIAAVSDHFDERGSDEKYEDPGGNLLSTYENLQRPVKAINFNV